MEPFCRSFHDRKAFALPESSERATESPTLMHVYRPTYDIACTKANKANKGWHIIHPMEHPCCFALDDPRGVAKFFYRQNQSVQKRLYHMYVLTIILAASATDASMDAANIAQIRLFISINARKVSSRRKI